MLTQTLPVADEVDHESVAIRQASVSLVESGKTGETEGLEKHWEEGSHR